MAEPTSPSTGIMTGPAPAPKPAAAKPAAKPAAKGPTRRIFIISSLFGSWFATAWTTFVAEIRSAIQKEGDGLKAKKGAGLRFLTETITSPSLAAQMKSILKDFPEAKWHQYEPANRDNARAGAMMAFGQPVNTIYDFSKADRILSLGSDFLACLPGSLR